MELELVITLLNKLARPIVILCVFLTVLFLVVRPATAWLAGRVRKRADHGEAQPAGPDAELEYLLEEAKEAEMTLPNQERIRRLAASDPEKAKALIRSWLHQN